MAHLHLGMRLRNNEQSTTCSGEGRGGHLRQRGTWGIMACMEILEYSHDMPAAQIIEGAAVKIRLREAPRRFYRHGWQSWSLATWTDASLRLPVLKPYLLHPMQHDPAYAFHPRPHGSWVGAVQMVGGETVLLGSLGLDAHVELDGNELVGSYEAGGGGWFIARGDELAVFSEYADELKKRLGAR